MKNRSYLIEMLPIIEQALGFQLYEYQRRFLLHGDPKIFRGGRCNGKTTAYCIKLALSEGEPFLVYPDSIKARYEPNELSDDDLRRGLYHAIVDETHGKRYEKFFKDMFIDIWRDLKEAGLPVRELRWNNGAM